MGITAYATGVKQRSEKGRTMTREEIVKLFPTASEEAISALLNMHHSELNAEKANLTGDEKVGYAIVKRALEEPIRQIADNAGLDGAVIADRAKNEKEGVGFNAATQEWVNMMDAGIIDPAKVTRCALQNAASVAGMLLTTECAITDIPEPPAPVAPSPDMGGMGY